MIYHSLIMYLLLIAMSISNPVYCLFREKLTFAILQSSFRKHKTLLYVDCIHVFVGRKLRFFWHHTIAISMVASSANFKAELIKL